MNKLKPSILSVFLIALFFSCTAKKATTQSIEPVKKEGVNLQFDNDFHDFGEAAFFLWLGILEFAVFEMVGIFQHGGDAGAELAVHSAGSDDGNQADDE